MFSQVFQLLLIGMFEVVEQMTTPEEVQVYLIDRGAL
jgi:hypothetical protein